MAILVGKNVSSTGHPIYARNEDLEADDCIHLIHYPRITHGSGEILRFRYVGVPQVHTTYAHWASNIYDPNKWGGDFMCGMNEYGVCIGGNQADSKETPIEKNHLIASEILKLAIERAATAYEAVSLIGELIKKYNGQDQTYCIGGPDGCWILETTASHWVALRCSDNGIISYANQYQIETEWTSACDDLIDYAIQQGWHDPSSGKPFNFKYCYGDRIDRPYNIMREKRGRSLLEEKMGRITIQDVMKVMRDHYEGTQYALYDGIDKKTSKDPYPYPPHQSPYRTICVPRTQVSMVCSLRSNAMPREYGNLMWCCMSSPCVNLYVPVYAGSQKAPEEYMTGEGKYDPVSAWWAFDMLQRLVDNHVIDRSYVRAMWDRCEQRALEQQEAFEKIVQQVHRHDPALIQELLTGYTFQHLSTAVDMAKLFVSQAFGRPKPQQSCL